MVKNLKRFAVLALIVGTAYFLIHRVRGLFQYPHLYLDLGKVGVANVVFLGLAVLSFALAVVAAVYLLFNAHGRVVELIIPFLCFLVLGGAGYFALNRAVTGIPCTYTTSLTAFGEDFNPEDFQVGSRKLYPEKLKGIVSGYAFYENGDVQVRRVTTLYEVKRRYKKEVTRLEELDLDAFAEGDKTCYTLRSGATVWQVVEDLDTQEITYTRYDNADQLPGFLPAIMTETQPEETEAPDSTEATAEPDPAQTEAPETADSTQETDRT